MKGDLVIGVDAGTSVIKAVAFKLDGEQVAMTFRPNSYDTPSPGHIEQDMMRTWADCAAALRDLHELVPNFASRVAAIAVTGQGDGTWLIDDKGEPVGGGLLWLDSRAATLCQTYMNTEPYAAHFALTGSGLSACMSSSQIAWMKRFQPERIALAATAFHCKDWLYFKLTGERATDPAEANFTFGNFRTRTYERSILEAMDILDCERLLPPIVDGVRVFHPLSAEAAAATGLPEGLPVVLAYLDVVCTGLSGGLLEPAKDIGVTIFGSTGMHMRCIESSNDVRSAKPASCYTMCLPAPGVSASVYSNMAATLNIDWLLDVAREAAAFAGAQTTRADLLQGMDARVMEAAPGLAIFHPYILEAGERGPFLDPNARAQFSGLSTQTTFSGLMRAVYEGLAFAARDCYLASGSVPEEVRLGGGAARSKAMRTILSAALGARVRTVKREETGAAGAAMTAAVCLGLYDNMGQCADAWVTPLLGEAIAPDPELAKLYSQLFPIYIEIRKQMTGAWEALAKVREVNT